MKRPVAPGCFSPGHAAFPSPYHPGASPISHTDLQEHKGQLQGREKMVREGKKPSLGSHQVGEVYGAVDAGE